MRWGGGMSVLTEWGYQAQPRNHLKGVFFYDQARNMRNVNRVSKSPKIKKKDIFFKVVSYAFRVLNIQLMYLAVPWFRYLDLKPSTTDCMFATVLSGWVEAIICLVLETNWKSCRKYRTVVSPKIACFNQRHTHLQLFISQIWAYFPGTFQQV